MASAAEKFRLALDGVEFRQPRLPVFSSTAAAPFEDPRAGLAAALTEPVIWQDTLKRMHADGARTFLETGPGDVLTGLVRRTLGDVEFRSLAEPETVNA
jgi:[acyl-carrier-protein] S-malonyltransferase